MTNGPETAIAKAAHQSAVGPTFGIGECLQRVRGLYGVGIKYPDAATAWAHTMHPHKTSNPMAPPRGVPLWWTGGSHGYGHVAISTGNGECWSTDIKRPGRFDKVRIADIERKWGMKLAGWSEDINDVRVYTPPAPKPEAVTVGNQWTRTRSRLLAALNHPDALGIIKSRVAIRAFLATIRTGLKRLPKE